MHAEHLENEVNEVNAVNEIIFLYENRIFVLKILFLFRKLYFCQETHIF